MYPFFYEYLTCFISCDSFFMDLVQGVSFGVISSLFWKRQLCHYFIIWVSFACVCSAIFPHLAALFKQVVSGSGGNATRRCRPLALTQACRRHRAHF